MSNEMAQQVEAARAENLAAQKAQYESQVRVTALIQAVTSEGTGTDKSQVLETASAYASFILNGY